MKTMAQVLEEHTAIGDEVDGVPEDELWCNKIECGFTMKRTIDYEEVRDFAAHQAAALSAAGFGLVADAGALRTELIVYVELLEHLDANDEGIDGSAVPRELRDILNRTTEASS